MDAVFSEKTKDKTNAVITGILFIIAAISSIVGLKLYDPVLASEDFIASANAHYGQVVWGALNELILAVSATGTGIMMYPYLKRYNESLGIGYLGFRMLEVVFIMVGTLSVLAVLSVSRHFAEQAITDKNTAESIGLALIAVHKWTFMLGPNFMLAINTFMYSYVFLRSGLVPPALSRAGIGASCLIMAAALLELFGIIEQISVWGILLALPIAAYEMTLAGRLIWKGFGETP